MSDDVLLDHAARLIADARVACLKLAIPPEEIAKIMVDEAILALMAERLSLSDIQARFKKYTKRDLPRFYINLKNLATDHPIMQEISPSMESEDSVEAEFTIAVLWQPPHSNAALCSHAA